MTPENVVVPVPAAMTKFLDPLMVLPKIILALLEVIVTLGLLDNKTGSEKFKGLAPLTVILLPI